LPAIRGLLSSQFQVLISARSQPPANGLRVSSPRDRSPIGIPFVI